MANSPEQWTLTAKQSLHLSVAFYLIFVSTREKQAEQEETVHFSFFSFSCRVIRHKLRTSGYSRTGLCWCFEVILVPFFYICTCKVTKRTMADFHLT